MAATEPTFRFWIRRTEDADLPYSLRFEVDEGKGVLRVARPGVIIDPPARRSGFEDSLAGDQLRASRFLHVWDGGRKRQGYVLSRLADSAIDRLDPDSWHELAVHKEGGFRYLLMMDARGVIALHGDADRGLGAPHDDVAEPPTEDGVPLPMFDEDPSDAVLLALEQPEDGGSELMAYEDIISEDVTQIPEGSESYVGEEGRERVGGSLRGYKVRPRREVIPLSALQFDPNAPGDDGHGLALETEPAGDETAGLDQTLPGDVAAATVPSAADAPDPPMARAVGLKAGVRQPDGLVPPMDLSLDADKQLPSGPDFSDGGPFIIRGLRRQLEREKLRVLELEARVAELEAALSAGATGKKGTRALKR